MALRRYLAIGPSQILAVTTLAAIFYYGRRHSLGKTGFVRKNVVHCCFQWILTLYWVLSKNPMGVIATLVGILRNSRWLPFH